MRIINAHEVSEWLKDRNNTFVPEKKYAATKYDKELIIPAMQVFIPAEVAEQVAQELSDVDPYLERKVQTIKILRWFWSEAGLEPMSLHYAKVIVEGLFDKFGRKVY